MPKISIGVDAEDVDGIEKVLGLAVDSLDWERISTDTIHPWVLRWTERQFETQGGHGAGPKWDDYSGEPQYRAFKKWVFMAEGLSIEPEERILRWVPDKERLYPSLTSASHPLHIGEVSGDTLRVGTSVPYARRLSEEGGTGPFDEPYSPRPIYRFTQGQQLTLLREIQRDIEKHGDVRVRREV